MALPLFLAAVPKKIWVYGGIALIVMLLGWRFVAAQQQIGMLEAANDSLAKTVGLQAQQAESKAALNLERERKQKALRQEERDLKHDLKQLPISEQHAVCDALPMPDGYNERVQQYIERISRHDPP